MLFRSLAALFPVLPHFFGVGYVELGLAPSIFNIITALVQAPLGFAVDHYGARRLLMAMAMAGITNAVYHPANYALLSQEINPAHIGKAFSVHTFAGVRGAAIAPVFLLGIATAIDLRLAFVGAALVGFVVLVLLLVPGSGQARVTPVRIAVDPAINAASTRRLPLLSQMILTLTLLFVLLNLSTSAIKKFSVAALMQGQGATFLTGLIAPSCDMPVWAASPKGAEGKTFGIVSTGFNIGGAIGPIVFGWMLDQRHPNTISWASSLIVVLALMQEWYLAKSRTPTQLLVAIK